MLKPFKPVRLSLFILEVDLEGTEGLMIELVETENAYYAYMFDYSYDLKMKILDLPKVTDDGTNITMDDFKQELNSILNDRDTLMSYVDRFHGLNDTYGNNSGFLYEEDSDVDGISWDDLNGIN